MFVVMLRCAACKSELSSSAEICPRCGEADPFLRKSWKHDEEQWPLYFSGYARHYGVTWFGVKICLGILGYTLYMTFGYTGKSGWYNNGTLLLILFLIPIIYTILIVRAIKTYPTYLVSRRNCLLPIHKRIEERVGKDHHRSGYDIDYYFATDLKWSDEIW